MSRLPSRLRHRWAAALAAAAALDTATFLLMGTAHELNPLAANHPIPAVIAKTALAVTLVLWPWPYARAVQIVGALAWSIGAISNVAVLT